MASDNTDDIIQYYSQNRENQRHQTQQLEFLIMEKVLGTYLRQKQLKILEIGAGAGYYTQRLAQMGHEIVALEPVEKLIQANQEVCQKLGFQDQIRWIHSDARKMREFLKESDEFDVILNMGPLYHLTEKTERVQLLKMSLEYLKKEGLHMATSLSRVGYLSYVLARQPESLLVNPEGFRSVMTEGFDETHPRDGTFRGYFADLMGLSQELGEAGLSLQTLHVLDPGIGGRDDIFNQLSEDQKAIWVEVLFALSADPSLWGSGRTWLTLSVKQQKE